MITMYDAVTVGNLPEDAAAIAAYVDGAYANLSAARERCPHASVLTVTVTGEGAGECFDIETGDGTPDQAPDFYHRARTRGVNRPCLYANLSTMPLVTVALRNAGIDRDNVRLWVAHFDNLAELPAGYDAKQYRTNGVDVSICAADFFDKPKPPPKPEGEAKAQIAYDLGTGKLRVEGVVGTVKHWGADRWVKLAVELNEKTGAWRVV